MSDAMTDTRSQPSENHETMRTGEDKSNGKFDGAKADVITWVLEQFPDAVEMVAWRAYAGAKKYSAGGWRHVEDGERRYRAALGRHILKIIKGELHDDDPSLAKHLPAGVRLTHWDAVAWNALAWASLALKRIRNG